MQGKLEKESVAFDGTEKEVWNAIYKSFNSASTNRDRLKGKLRCTFLPKWLPEKMDKGHVVWTTR